MAKGKLDARKKSEVLQGTLDLMILKTLQAMGPLHGFGIARRLEQLSEEVLHLNEGTVYTSLLRLQQEGWIAVGVGRFGEQPQSEVLFDYQERPETTGERDGGLGAYFRRDRPRAEAGGPEVMSRRFRKLWERLRAALRDAPSDPEFQTEMEEHLRLLAERYRRQGMTPDAAMLAARRQFGNTTLLQEDRRAMQSIPPSMRSEATWLTPPGCCARIRGSRRRP